MDIHIRRWVLVAAVTLLSPRGVSTDALAVVCPQKVEGRVGQAVLLQCHLNRGQNATAMEVRWYRKSFTKPVSLYKDGMEMTDIQDKAYHGRAQLVRAGLPNGNLTLQLKNICVSDEGTFTVFIQSHQDYKEVSLDLLVAAAGDVEVFDDLNAPERRLVCKSTGWYPAPIVTWESKGSAIEKTWETKNDQNKGGFFYTVSLLPLPGGHRDSYSCIVRNPLLGTQLTANITVSDHLPPWAIFLIILGCLLPVPFISYGVYRYLKQKEGKRTHEMLKSTDVKGDLNSFRKKNQNLEVEDLEMLTPFLQKTQEIDFFRNNLKATHCKVLASNLLSKDSLRELKLRGNKLTDIGIKALCEELKKPECMLQTLEMSYCSLTSTGMADLSKALETNGSLRELTLSENKLTDEGVQKLCQGLRGEKCCVTKLRLSKCCLTDACCDELASLLSSHKTLMELELWNNSLSDSGVRTLCVGLESSDCQLQRLGLFNCQLTGACCEAIASVLSRSKCLRELNLGENAIEDSGMKELCKGLENQGANLENLMLSWCELTDECVPELCSMLRKNVSLRKLDLSHNKLMGSRVMELCEALRTNTCRVHTLDMLENQMSQEAYDELQALDGIKVSTGKWTMN